MPAVGAKVKTLQVGVYHSWPTLNLREGHGAADSRSRRAGVHESDGGGARHTDRCTSKAAVASVVPMDNNAAADDAVALRMARRNERDAHDVDVKKWQAEKAAVF